MRKRLNYNVKFSEYLDLLLIFSQNKMKLHDIEKKEKDRDSKSVDKN